MQTILVAALAAAITVSAPAAATDAASVQQVRQVEDAWSQAFVSGDTASLTDLLDPDYVSISASGASRNRDEVLELARRYAQKNPGQTAQPLASSSKIQVRGALALVIHRGPNDVSVDVLHFGGGHWRAIYSQHTAVGK